MTPTLNITIQRPSEEEVAVLRMLADGEQPPSTKQIARLRELRLVDWEKRTHGQGGA